MDSDDENGEEVVEGKNPYQYIRTNNDVIVKIFNNTLSSEIGRASCRERV